MILEPHIYCTELDGTSIPAKIVDAHFTESVDEISAEVTFTSFPNMNYDNGEVKYFRFELGYYNTIPLEERYYNKDTDTTEVNSGRMAVAYDGDIFDNNKSVLGAEENDVLRIAYNEYINSVDKDVNAIDISKNNDFNSIQDIYDTNLGYSSNVIGYPLMVLTNLRPQSNGTILCSFEDLFNNWAKNTSLVGHNSDIYSDKIINAQAELFGYKCDELGIEQKNSVTIKEFCEYIKELFESTNDVSFNFTTDLDTDIMACGKWSVDAGVSVYEIVNKIKSSYLLHFTPLPRRGGSASIDVSVQFNSFSKKYIKQPIMQFTDIRVEGSEKKSKPYQYKFSTKISNKWCNGTIIDTFTVVAIPTSEDNEYGSLKFYAYIIVEREFDGSGSVNFGNTKYLYWDGEYPSDMSNINFTVIGKDNVTEIKSIISDNYNVDMNTYNTFTSPMNLDENGNYEQQLTNLLNTEKNVITSAFRGLVMASCDNKIEFNTFFFPVFIGETCNLLIRYKMADIFRYNAKQIKRTASNSGRIELDYVKNESPYKDGNMIGLYEYITLHAQIVAEKIERSIDNSGIVISVSTEKALVSFIDKTQIIDKNIIY